MRCAVLYASPTGSPTRSECRRCGAPRIQSTRELLLELAEVLGHRRPLGVEGLALASTVRETLAALERGQRTASINER